MTEIVTNPGRSQELVDKERKATISMRAYLDDITLRLNEFLLNPSGVQLPIYTVATVPVQKTGSLIFVSDETGGAVPAFSDGTNWRRVTDRIIVSS